VKLFHKFSPLKKGWEILTTELENSHLIIAHYKYNEAQYEGERIVMKLSCLIFFKYVSVIILQNQTHPKITVVEL
jgi:hypothetical protein